MLAIGVDTGTNDDIIGIVRTIGEFTEMDIRIDITDRFIDQIVAHPVALFIMYMLREMFTFTATGAIQIIEAVVLAQEGVKTTGIITVVAEDIIEGKAIIDIRR